MFARKSEFPDIDVYVEAFRTDLAAVDQDNRLFLAAHLQDVFRSTPGDFELADMTQERDNTVSEYRATLTALQTLLIRERDGIDALGPDFRDKVEGVRRVRIRINLARVEAVDFTGGSIKAIFALSPDGEPLLITLYPEGVL